MEGCWSWCHRTCVCCLTEEERGTIAVDKEIQRILRQQKQRERKEIKVLLLGTGESGKTTFIRQMRIIHGRGFSEEERRAFAKLIFQNIFTAVKAMTGAMTTLKIPYSNKENEMYAKWVQDVDTVQVTQLDRGYVDAIRHLWADAGLRACYGRRSEYQLLDSTEYYMSNLDRLAAQDYIPTAQDVLRVRFPTTGIHDYAFNVKAITPQLMRVTPVDTEANGKANQRVIVPGGVPLADVGAPPALLLETVFKLLCSDPRGRDALTRKQESGEGCLAADSTESKRGEDREPSRNCDEARPSRLEAQVHQSALLGSSPDICDLGSDWLAFSSLPTVVRGVELDVSEEVNEVSEDVSEAPRRAQLVSPGEEAPREGVLIRGAEEDWKDSHMRDEMERLLNSLANATSCLTSSPCQEKRC
ncbi:uncharacterized protein [Osmerus mordax]|uniref:uncharacterized protein n=1 Tax=Osmerus mordax TaxID=8014 RepID=UPI003510050F